MGGFALSKIKRRGPRLLLPRTSTPPLKSTLPEGDVTDASSDGDSEASTFITYESSHDDSTMSSIHTDSLTSFAGNLSPPEIEFLGGNVEVVSHATGKTSIIPRQQVKKHRLPQSDSCHEERNPHALQQALVTSVRRQESGSSSATSRRKGRQESRSSPALPTDRSSKQPVVPSEQSPRKQEPRPAKQERQSSDKSSKKSSKISPKKSTEDDVNEKSPSPPVARQSSKKKTETAPARKAGSAPAKGRTIKTAIVNHSSAQITSILNIISVSSSVMGDLSPTVEIGREMNDEENTVITQELLEGIDTYRGGNAACNPMMHLFGDSLDCIETFTDESNEKDSAMVSLFDDEGNQFIFEKRKGEVMSSVPGKPQEIGSLATGKSTLTSKDSSFSSESGDKISDKVGTEIVVKKKYQAGNSVVKHMNTLYKMNKQASDNSKKSNGSSKIKKEEVDLVEGVLEIETRRSGSSSSKENRGGPERSKSGRIDSLWLTPRNGAASASTRKDSIPVSDSGWSTSRSLTENRRFAKLNRKDVCSRSAGSNGARPEDDDSRWVRDDDSKLFQC